MKSMRKWKERGSALVRYQCNGDTPHSELLSSAVLKKKTTPSGHTHCPQKYESTNTVAKRDSSPVEAPQKIPPMKVT
jgi:hypothetical protein